MNRSFTVEKVLNNNVLIALHDDYREVVLIGKGIGFGKKRGDLIEHENYEKCLSWKMIRNNRSIRSSSLMSMKKWLISPMMLSTISRKNRPAAERTHSCRVDGPYRICG